MKMTYDTSLFGDMSRRSFVGATALGAAALALGGSASLEPAQAFAADDSEETIGYTTCNMCNQTPKCGLKAHLKDGKIVRVEGNPDHVMPTPCVKGYSSVQALYDPNRLLYPIKRTNPDKSPDADPGWERISWDEALDTIATEFNKAKEAYGPDSVLFNVGDPKENLGALNRLGNLFGSANIAYGGAQCQYGLIIAGITTFGTFLASHPTPETKVHIIWGSNNAWSVPIAYKGQLDLKRKGVKFIVVDTRMTPSVVQLADLFLQPRTGTDGALALAIANVMIEENLIDEEFVGNWVEGFDEFKEYASQFTPEKAEEITWVPADSIREAARMWGSGEPGTLWVSPHSTTHHTNGVQNQRAINALIALAGNIDIEGGIKIAKNPLPYDTYGSTPEFGRFDLMDEKKDRRAGVDRWPIWSKVMRHMQNDGLVEYIDDGIIHAALFLGSNVMVFPQTRQYQEAIAKLDFACGMDFYVRPLTHNVLDIVLPVAMCFERMAPFASVGGSTMYVNDVLVEPQGEAREDWKILLDLGCKLGFEEECFHGNVETAVAALLETGNPGVTLDDLRAALPAGYKVEGEKWSPKKYETGGLRKDGEPGFNTPSGKVELVSAMLKADGYDGLPVYNEPLASPVSTPDLFETYPLVLGTGSRVPQYVHSKWRQIPWLNQFMPEPVVFISPEDAEERGLKEGDAVRLCNQHGELKVKAAISNIMRPGIVEFHHGWECANSCELIARDFDPISGFPPYKDGLCQVEKV